jgi:hypothetical protein
MTNSTTIMTIFNLQIGARSNRNIQPSPSSVTKPASLKNGVRKQIISVRRPCAAPRINSEPATNVMPMPLTVQEQYWAARALTAETLLTAGKAHYRELQYLSYREKQERLVSQDIGVIIANYFKHINQQHALSALGQSNDERMRKLETLIVSVNYL